MNLPVIFPVLLLLGVTACKYDCRTPSVVRWDPGYNSAQTAVIIIRSYEHKPGVAFGKLLFTTVTGWSVPATVPGTDTIAWSEEVTHIDMKYNIEIELPAIGRIYKLRDFSVHQNRQTNGIFGGYTGCSNTISYYLDDVLYEQTPNADGMNFPPPVVIPLK